MKGLVKPRICLSSAIAGICTATSIWLLFFNNLLLSRKSILIWAGLFLFATAAFALVYKTLPKSSASAVIFRNPFFQAAVLLGAGFFGISALGYDPGPPLMLLPAQTIQFNAAKSGNPLSSGNIVEIHGIQNGDAWVILNRLDLSGERQIEEASVYLLPSPAGNTLRIRANQQLRIYFRTRPDGGLVEITAGGQRETLDLYSVNEGVLPRTYLFPVPDSLFLLADIIHSLGFGYGLFLVAAVVFTWISKGTGKVHTAWKAGKHEIGLLLLLNYLFTCIRALFSKDARYQQISRLVLILFFIWLLLLILEIIFHRLRSKKEPGIFQSISNDFLLKKQFRAHPPSNYALILIPLTPIVQYLLNNIDLFSFAGILGYLGFFVFICLAFAFLPSFLLSPVADRRFMLIGCLSYQFVVFNMPFINGTFSGEDTLLKIGISLAYLIGLQALAYFLMRRKQHLAHIFSIGFFVISIFPLALDTDRTDRHAQESDMAGIVPVTFVRRPDILLLVYESYSDPETLALFGIDQSAHFKRLEEYGFILYPGVWTVDFPTLGSISKLFSMSDSVSSSRYQIIGNSPVHQILRQNGYQINGMIAHDFLFTGNINNIQMDRYFPHKNSDFAMQFAMQILDGELDDRILFEKSDQEIYLKMKRAFLRTDYPSPQFLYSQGNFPGHTPPNPINRENYNDHFQTYQENLETANKEMMEDIEIALKNNPGAIIIVAGDHGPGLTGDVFPLREFDNQENVNRLNLMDRFGIFLAIKWPAGMDVDDNIYDVKILQDLFPFIFSVLSDDPSLYEKLRISPQASASEEIKIIDGIIRGGVDDGAPLFQCSGRGVIDCSALVEHSE